MTPLSIKYSLGLSLWGVVLTGTFSIAGVPGQWGHDICGPWGCGPPVQALLAWHLSWIVLLVPLSFLAGFRLTPTARNRTCAGLLVLFATAMLAVAAHECLIWYPSAGDAAQQFIVQRIGFRIVTLVEAPILELLLPALILADPVWRLLFGCSPRTPHKADGQLSAL